jgi:hypothetical protein
LAKKKPLMKKKMLPKMSKGANALVDSLSGGGMTNSPPPDMGSMGPMMQGIMGPEMNYPAPGPNPKDKSVFKGKPKKKVVKKK